MRANRWPLIIFFVILSTGCQDRSSKRGGDNDFPAENTWSVIGPGGGGGVMKPTISPFDENFVITHCDMTAAYLTLDGGDHWKMKNLWTVPEDFEFDPVDQHTVYAATRGYRYSEDRGSGLSILYRSENRGESWRIVYPDLEKIKKSEQLQNTDYLPSEIIDGALDGTIAKVKVDPVDNRRIYLGMAPLRAYMGSSGQDAADSAMLVRSANYGEDWELLTRLPGKSIKAIFPCQIHGSPGEVIVFTESACISVNENTGATRILPVPVKTIIAAEGGYEKDGGLLYIQSTFENEEGKVQGGMYVSRDLGRSWTLSNNGLFKEVPEGMVPRFRQGLAVCEKQPAVAYISTMSPVKNEDGNTEIIYSVYRTVNGGGEWHPVLLSST
ncbi:MAG: hypothetical protein KAI95_14510, partial [Bacteroidales bacterium]|nr:hypothetical protein [Bacteroidales bacterium]